jgi:hypothetical protein
VPFRNIFAPPSPAPMQMDTAELADLSDVELRARLDGIAQQRREVSAQYHARVAPLLERREKLLAEAAKLESEIAYQGIIRSDHERAWDRDVQRLQAELRARAVVGDADGDVDDAVDQRAADDLLERMLSGRTPRNMVVAGNATTTEACQDYDRLEAEAAAWMRLAAQTRSTSGRMPERPGVVERFNPALLQTIAQRRWCSAVMLPEPPTPTGTRHGRPSSRSPDR